MGTKTETRGRKRNIAVRLDHSTPRLAKKLRRDQRSSPFTRENFSGLKTPTACEAQPLTRTPGRVALLKPRHVKERFQLAKDHSDWPEGKWRNNLQPGESVKTVKHAGASVMDSPTLKWEPFIT